jgi:starvation-inducible DNA-binding protein
METKHVSRADERHFVRRAEENQLQRQLRDLICLAVVGDHVRWVVTGDDELVDWLAQATGEWRKWADRVAKQLTASGVAPDGRVRSLAISMSLNWVPAGWLSADQAQRLVSDRLAAVAGSARSRHSQADGADAELLEFVSEGLEAQLRARQDIGTKTAAEKPADRARLKREKVSTR